MSLVLMIKLGAHQRMSSSNDDRQVKMNTKQNFPHCVWGSYVKTSPMSCLQLDSRRNINIKLK
jgi:hypothetical protein